MFSRRTLLKVAGSLVCLGCTKTPELPPASDFLKDFQLMDRDGKLLPSDWSMSQSQPLDPTLQFSTVQAPTLLEGRKVLPADQWIITVDARGEHEESRRAEVLRSQDWYGEESIDQNGPLVWESPDVPQSLPKTTSWNWCHLRVPDAGRYSLVFKLYPTAYQLGNGLNYDYGPGIELARQAVVVEHGEKPKGTLQLSVKNGKALNRAQWRKTRSKLK